MTKRQNLEDARRRKALTAVKAAVHDYARNPCAATEKRTIDAMEQVKQLSLEELERMPK